MRRLFAPFLGPPGSFGLLLLRLVVGLAFMMHGWPKIQKPMEWMGPDAWAPGFLQALAAFAEFGGGLALMLGLVTPLASLGILAVMTAALFGVHFPRGDVFVPLPGTAASSFELPALYAAIAVMFLLVGPGRFSLDALLFMHKEEAVPAQEEKREKVPV